MGQDYLKHPEKSYASFASICKTDLLVLNWDDVDSVSKYVFFNKYCII